ncbi:MAG TPA: carbohydrate binding domain-containing protein, partial [Verrucomicrobium sp.]|nr:carbohydrate binding domain-containing protein [Verrucomicrobium sp.]
MNPHTGRAYKDEPGVAVIEMNNENSILLNPWWTASLPEPFKGELRELFVSHLKGQGKSTAALQAAWGVNDGTTGPELIKNGSFNAGLEPWFAEATSGAKAAATATGDGAVRWTSTQSGSLLWSMQFTQAGLRFDENASYRLSFKARSQEKSSLSITAQNAAPPWAELGLREQVILEPEWKEYHFEFSPHSVLPDGKNRIGFGLLNKITTVEIKDVRLHTVPSGFLKTGQSLEAGNIPLPERGANAAVRKDFFDFLAQLEIDHASEMKKFIREEIGAKQMILHSQVLFGGIAGARREFAVSDMVDTHGYWHHPSFPRKSWDMNDWYIDNVSQVVEKSGGTLAEIAMQRPVGKPYSLSEYDVPAPNDYAAETFPLLAAMASLQDWSAV